MMKHLQLPFWPLLPLLSLRLSPRLMPTLTFCTEDMDMDILAMPATTDTLMPTMDLPTTESVRLMPSPRLMLTPTFCMVDTTDTVLAMLDTTDIPMPTELPTTERDLLMLSLRLMLILIFFMVDMDMDTLDTVDTMDTHMVDMPTTDKLLIPKPYPATEN